MLLTVVIPVLNGEKYIDRCINALKSMTNSNLEIIVIDNGSSDSTIDILKANNIYYEVHSNVNVSELRNIGAKKAIGKYIGFVDSDCLVNYQWMSEAINILESNNTIGIVGRFYSIGDNPTWVEKAWCEKRKDIEGYVNFLPAGNMVIKKELFMSLGGFSKDVVTGEDYELCQRVRKAGYNILNTKLVDVKHLGNMKKLSDIIRKERWYGLGMLSTNKLHDISKPLIATIIFMVIISSIIISFVSSLILTATLISILMAYLLIVSIEFTKNISKNKLYYVIIFVPIVACYLIGRSLSIVDVIINKTK